MESHTHELSKRENEFRMYNPSDYKVYGQALASDGRMRYLIKDINSGRFGIIYNKKYPEDDSYYAPYLMQVIGKKVGVDVPDAELGILLEMDLDKGTYRDSFFESSVVFRDDIDDFPFSYNQVSHAHQQVVHATFLMENEDQAERRREQNRGRVMPMNFEEYIESNVYYMISRGAKPRGEYTKAEMDNMRQELVDRALLGLKLGVQGTTNISLFNNAYAKLDPYYLSSTNMLGFSINKKWSEEMLGKTDDEFRESIDFEFKPQFGVPYNYTVPTQAQLLRHIFSSYPEQAEKAYKKVSKFTTQDLEQELDKYTRMDPTHKKLAIRIFDARSKELDKAYKEHKKTRDQDR